MTQSPSENETDDDAIVRALRVSLGCLLALGAAAGGTLYLLSREKPADPTAPIRVTLPQRRPTPSVAVPALPFTEVASQSGIDFVHDNRATGEKLLPETMGGGCAFLDYDGDGDQDLAFIDSNHWPWQEERFTPSLRLFANDGKGRFEEATQSAGVELRCYGMGIAAGDYDNDGDADLFVTAVGSNCLLRNDKGVFNDVTELVGVGGGAESWSTSAGWFDYDNDGHLDLVVGNYVEWSRDIDIEQDFTLAGVGRAYGPPFSFAGSFPYLYRNRGDGTFADVSASAGVQVVNAATGVPLAKTLGVRPVDVDRDGWIDLLLANDTVQNLLLRNRGDGTFTEVGVETGIAFDAAGKARGAMGIDAARFQEDGVLGVAIGNFAGEMTALYIADAEGAVFTDDAIPSGLGPRTRLDLSFGLFFFDADLDGRLDLLSANGHIEGEINRFQASQHYRQPTRLFWNAGSAGADLFVPVGETSDLSKPIVGRGAAFADIDADGDADVVVTQIAGPPLLLRNDQSSGHHWIRIRLIGEQCNRDAIGATVTATIGNRTLVREVAPTRSYLSQVELPVTLGLGDARSIDRIVVRWPDGSEQAVTDAVIDGLIEVRQDAPNPQQP